MHSSGNRILLSKSGRSSFLFDVDALHDRLSVSFRACDIRNVWMIDDILIALQCGLKENNRPFCATEEAQDQLHASLLKVLGDNGFKEVANHFRNSLNNNTQFVLEKRIEKELSTLTRVFSRRQVLLLTDKITALGYDPENISALLIREICRLEYQLWQREQRDETPPESSLGNSLPFSKEFVTWDWRVLQLKAVGNLFNSVRIEINPFELAEVLKMTPFMEITFMMKWQEILTESADFLENSLLDLEEKNLEKIDYFSIVIRDVEKMVDFCDISTNSIFIAELHQSLESAFSSVVSQFTKTPLRKL